MASTQDLNRLRIDHIGSLVRPAKLREVFARNDRGQTSKEEWSKAQDEAIRDVIQKQEAHGFPVVTDGEFRRHNFQESFSECITGFDVPVNVSTITRNAMSIRTPSSGPSKTSTRPVRRLSPAGAL